MSDAREHPEPVAPAALPRRRRLFATLLALGVVVVAVAVVTAVQVAGRDRPARSAERQAPAVRAADGSIVLAQPGVEHPVIEVYEDFRCPGCKLFNQINGVDVRNLASEGRAKVVYRPFQLFRTPRAPEAMAMSSRRAANAALCVPAGAWTTYAGRLFAHQPPEGEDGFSPEDLIRWGDGLGMDQRDFSACVTTMRHTGRVDEMSRYADRHGVRGTPAVLLDGRKLSINEMISAGGVRKAVLAVR
jgi:protein-disulfide isomerase